MVSLFGRGKKQKEKEEEFKQAMALTEEQAEGRGGITQDDYERMLGRTALMIKDEREDKLFDSDELYLLVSAFNALNAVTNIDEKEAKIRSLKYKILLLKMKGGATGKSLLVSALELRSRTIVSNALNGWLGKILTEQTKTTRIELEKKKGRSPF